MVDGRSSQIEKIEQILRKIEVPADGAFPAIDMEFLGPVERIATHFYDVLGVRVLDVKE